MRTFSLLPAFVLIGVCLGAEQEPAKTPPTMETTGPAHAGICVAVLGSQTAGIEKLVPLVELRLGNNKEIALLEREKIKEIFREQELGALLTAEGTAKRITLGKLLKADLLVILQGEEKPQPHARVTICETKQGLRLCNRPVEFSKNIEADADAVLRLAEKAVEKQQKPIVDIVAVPPFVNNTLAYEGDHLKAACAKLIEEMLFGRPGVLVVELAEAKAIAQELAIGGGTVERRLPLYLMGEYRLEGTNEKRKVQFKLELLRGATRVDACAHEATSVEAFPKEVQEAARNMLSKALGQAVQPPDLETEAKQLAQRAKLSARLGIWDEALTLTESSLLLKPDQIDLHGDAIHYMDALLSQIAGKENNTSPWYQAPRDGAMDRMVAALLPANLFHAEIYLSHVNHGGFQYLPMPGICCDRTQLRTQNAATQKEFEREKVRFEPVMAMCRHVLEAQAAARDPHPTIHLFSFTHLPINGFKGATDWRGELYERLSPQIRADSLTLLEKFSYFKGDGFSSYQDILGAIPTEDGANGIHFLRKLAAVPFLRRAVDTSIRSCISGECLRILMERTDKAMLCTKLISSGIGRVPVRVEKQETADISFHIIKGTPALDHCLPTLAGIDLFMGGDALYLVTKKGEFLRLPEPLQPPEHLGDPKHGNICFDGRFIWVGQHDPDRSLAVIEPTSQRIWRFTAGDELPPMNACCLAPLAPGKVCVAGYFGRTWCAIATFDREKGKSLNVFFEAKEVFDSRHIYGPTNPNFHVAMNVGALTTITATSRDGKPPEQRVYLVDDISRGLLIDPRKCVVERVVPGARRRNLYSVSDGSLYWSMEGKPGPMRRFGFPDFKLETVHADGRFGPSVFYNGRIYMWNGSLSVAQGFKEEFKELKGTLPVTGDFGEIIHPCVSQHYGLVLFAGGKCVQIGLEKPEIASLPANPQIELKLSPADAIAEIESRGGRVLLDENAPGRPVIAVQFSGYSVNDAVVAHLHAFPELRSLRINTFTITDAGLARLKGLAKLQSLSLDLCDITDAGLGNLQELPQLTTLELLHTNRITARGIAHLARLKNLRSLTLAIRDLNNTAVARLGALTNIETLQLWWTSINDAGLASLKNLPRLRSLEIGDSPITGAGLAHLKDLASLESVNLTFCNIGDADLAHLKQLPKLRMLDLTWTNITDAGMEHIAGCVQLESLSLNDTQVSDLGLKHLAALHRLRSLELQGTQVTDAGVAFLCELSQLHTLNVGLTAITDAGLEGLTRIPGIQSLNLYGTRITDAGLEPLQRLTRLESLNLGHTRVTDAGVAFLVPLSQLNTLKLEKCRKVTDSSLVPISRLLKLQSLDIRNTALGDQPQGIMNAMPQVDVRYRY
ncbi:MAG: hypothetical protein WCJ35_11975 [Planctomycetota bacterium]